ncbi:hypothetical protein [Marinomonas aquiplantarum]|uniref:Uncharacterized protein n=1 Tax=Marinomonas aquiplantarum TaxID=491951 RepID=A0A366CXV2_9GAMM|nr:hypothetical protein [Marinomonas aquiplantarum]RBO82671.1 hypothetical protein DFP76_105142 [Marinomonas aquiplantarum]
MLKLIKQIYSDLTEFFLLLFTGVFAGSIFTLAYLKTWQEGDVTFADIGGMLAGAATLGLFLAGLSWKKQISYQNNLKALSDWYIRSLSYNRYLKDTLGSSLAAYTFFREELHEIKSNGRSIKDELETTKDIQARSILVSDLEKNDQELTKIREYWHIHQKEYLNAYYESKKQKYPLQDLESILISLLTDQAQKNELLQLNEYFRYDGKEVGVHGLKTYEHQFHKTIDDKKIAIDRFYTKSITELH